VGVNRERGSRVAQVKERPMKNPAVRTQMVLERIARPNTRSSLFWWLFEHHDAVMQSAEGRRLDWKGLCATFESEGLTDLDGNPANARTARMTWWRVRKERGRIDALRAAERAERERRAAANPRRDMPSQFRKGEYGPPLAVTLPTAKLPATIERQAERSFQLSTAQGVVVTKAGRVVKLEEGGENFVFEEDGTIVGTTNWAAVLRSKQQLNLTGRRPINDGTAEMYAKLGLRSEEQ
jgi:hypothetical protein